MYSYKHFLVINFFYFYFLSLTFLSKVVTLLSLKHIQETLNTIVIL